MKNTYILFESDFDFMEQIPRKITVRFDAEVVGLSLENAILKRYSLFRLLVKNNRRRVHFNMLKKSAVYEKLTTPSNNAKFRTMVKRNYRIPLGEVNA